jgi:2,4-dienoyl-CoA reductase-like NADH-dependent reductase (Old Yellow Enzyme family)
MTERLCTYDKENLSARGKPTEEYLRLYKTWGEGKIGVIVTGNVPVRLLSLLSSSIVDLST